MTTPQMVSSVSRAMEMDGYLGFSASRRIPFRVFLRRLTVSSPSTTAMTTLLFFASSDRSTIRMSLSNMPAPVMESPSTLTKKVAGGLLTR